MRRVLAVSVVVAWAALGAGASAQVSWRLLSPLPTPESLRSVDMVSASEAWAVGDNGAIVHTADGGLTWDVQPSGTQALLNAVSFVDATRGVVVGNSTLYTTDGRTWRVGTRTGPLNTLRDVDLVDPLRGWACGADCIARTTDGGASWTGQAVPAAAGKSLSAIDFVDAMHGWAVGSSSAIIATIDGGATWTEQDPGASAFLTGVSFVSPLEGWAVGGSTLLHTRDGGASWTSSTLPAWVATVHFRDALHGWAVGPGIGSVLTTSDGGQSWAVRPLNIPAGPSGVSVSLNAIEVFDGQGGIAVGLDGVIAATSDAGATWALRQQGDAGVASQLVATDRQHVWELSDRGLINISTDGGDHWTRTRPSNMTAAALHMVDHTNGWGVGTDGANFEGHQRIFTTSDGAMSWTMTAPPERDDRAFRAVWGTDMQHAVAVGGDLLSYTPYMVRTVDGGQSWQTIPEPFPFGTWLDVTFVDASTGWIVGINGRIIKTTDGGASWTVQMDQGGTGPRFYSVSFSDANTGWVVGTASNDGTLMPWVLKTSNGGATWTRVSIPTATILGTGSLLKVKAFSAQVAWVAGLDGSVDGYVARTADGGATWNRELPPPHRAFYSMAFIDGDYGWVGGVPGTGRPAAEASGVWRRSAGAVCYANCDGSSAAPVLNIADFSCFLQKFAASDPYANCDLSTAAPVLNVADFSCFLQKFAAGCP